MYAKIAEEAKSVTSSIGWKIKSIGRIPRLGRTSSGATKTGDPGGGVRRDRKRHVHLVPVCEDDGAGVLRDVARDRNHDQADGAARRADHKARDRDR